MALEVARKAALAAAEVEGQAGRRRQKLKEPIAMELPVAVMTQPPCPGDPVPGLRLPGISQAHEVCRTTVMPRKIDCIHSPR